MVKTSGATCAPAVAAIYANKAAALSALGRAAEAIVALERALSHDPSYGNADRQLASLLSKSAATGYSPTIETALQRCFDSPRVDMPLETWPPPVREVVEMTLLEPLIEQSIKPAIDTLGSLTDAISICGANSTDPTPDSSRGTFCGVKSFDDTAAIRPNFRCPDREIQCIEFHVNQHTDTMNLV